MAVLSVTASALAFTVDGLNYSVSNGVATLTGATSRTITSLSIPATVTSGGKTYPVRYITYNAFQNYSSLRSVRIEDSETPLGCQPYQYGGQIFYYSSFANCPVEEFYIGRDIVRRVSGGFAIDFVVLGSSSSNVDIAFGGGATYVPTKFALYQSLKATQITGLTIGGAIDEFGKEIFSEAVNLKTLTLNPGEYSVQASMFPEGHVFETLNLKRTFSSQLPLDAVHVAFSEAWTEIPVGFLGSKKKLQKVTLPETIGKIGSQAFNYCDVLSEINFPSSLREIGSDAFKSCPLLSDIQLNEGLEIVYNGAFERCAGPESLVIPGTVTKVDYSAFAENSNIKEIEILPSAFSPEIHIGSRAFGVGTVNMLKIGRTVLSEAYNYPFQGCTPEEIVFGEAWTEIPSYLYYDKTALKAVTLPETVEKIAIGAFSQCNSLTSVNFPASLKEIGRSAFQGCTELSGIVLNEGLEVVDYEAFKDCRGPERLVLPSSLKKVGSSAFYGCSNIKEIEFLSSTDNPSIAVDNSAFGVGAVDRLILGRTVTHDAYNVPFKECSPAEIVFGEAWTEIPSNLFDGMSDLKAVTLPETVEKIAIMAFYQCNSLRAVNFPASLKEIGRSAFQGCTELSGIVLNAGLEVVDYEAFKDCRGPERLVLPSSLKKVGSSAFYGCSNIKEIEFLSSTDNPSIAVDNSAFGVGAVDRLILGRTVTHDAYNVPFKECSPAEIVFGEAWTEIPSNLFDGMSDLKAVTLPETVEKIAIMAFYQCNSLRAVNFPASLKEIGRSAFHGCAALSDIRLNEGLERIGSEAFRECQGPERLVLLSSLKEIGTSAFYGCNNIDEIEILPSADGSPLLLDSGAIGVGRLSTLKLDRLVEPLAGAYSNWLSECSPENVVFGDAWTDIPNIGLGGKESLKSLSFPATLEHIGTNTFTGCPAVERVECKAVVPPVCEPDGQWFNVEVYGTAELIIPLGSRGAYEEAVMWKNFAHIKCEGAHLVTAVYDREAGAVTLNGADDARIDVADGSALEFVITPAEGIRISKAMLNKRDITAELDAEGRYTVGAVTEPHVLNVEFEKIPTGIESIVGAPNEGTDFSKPFEIYRLDGVRVFKTLDELIPGVYILRQDGKVFKFSV